MQDKKDGRIVLTEEASNEKFMEGARATYDAVTTSYGPRGKNLRMEKVFGFPVLSRDGVSIAREVYFSDRAKNMGAQALLEASEVTNRIAGDGTTACVALGYHLLVQGQRAIAAGIHPMEIARIYRNDSQVLIEALSKMSRPVKGSQLKEVAIISCGDPVLGQLIADSIEKVGPDGGVMVERAPISDIQRTYINGYYLQSGFQALQAGKKEILEPITLIFEKRVASSSGIGEMMDRAARAKGLTPGKDPAKFLLIGNVEDAAFNQVVALINQGAIDGVIIKPPAQFGSMSKDLLEDIAIYAGCSVISESTKPKDIGAHHVGVVDKVVAGKYESTLFADNATERVQVRVQSIRDAVESEISDAVAEKLRDRAAKLEGKIALFKIGGATDTEKEETEFRVEDALQASRAAYRSGIVPGGGVTLLALAKEKGLSEYYRRALQDTVRQLFANANPDEAEVMLRDALAAKPGEGYNLREDTHKLVDVVKSGVVDPTLVISEVVRNATSAAAENLKVGASLIFEDKASE